MSKFKEKEETTFKEPEITTRDIENLRSELKRFPQMKINGALVSPFEQYLCSLGTMKFSNSGIIVHDAVGYTRMSKINAKLEMKQYYEEEDFMNQNPEARAAQQTRLNAMKAGLAAKLQGTV
jgi:hypothetical protein